MQTGRSDRRLATKMTAILEAADEPGAAETVVFDNVSERGARLITSRPWNEGRRVIVSDLLLNLRVEAEVVYCVPHTSLFAIGLRFTEHFALAEAAECATPKS
jgi:PilZ domain